MTVNFIKLQKGFTLAEVLVTLAVIGIVASLTIPALIRDYQDKELRSAWKKNFSTFSQAAVMKLAESGQDFSQYLDDYGDNFCNNLQTDLKIIKHGSIFTDSTTPAFNYKYLNGNNASFGIFDDSQYVLNNGAFIACNCNNCNTISGHIMWIDVNGYLKGPNVVGRDVFGLKLYKSGFKPMGVAGDEYENTCNTTSAGLSGWGCGAEYLK